MLQWIEKTTEIYIHIMILILYYLLFESPVTIYEHGIKASVIMENLKSAKNKDHFY